jgi:uncharacterized SAM-binding protein YcdF (DUF218 family)
MKISIFKTIMVITLFLGACSFSEKQTIAMYQKAATKKPYDAIIVPGIPYEKGTENAILRSRVFWSYYLYSNGITQNVIYSGSSVYTPYTESKAMSVFGQYYGVKKENILTETRAEHSVENVYYSWLIAKNKGYKSIALASDPKQVKLMRIYARKKHIKIDYIPIVYSFIDSIPKSQPEVNDSLRIKSGFIPLPERKTLWQRLMGTLGRNIKYVK